MDQSQRSSKFKVKFNFKNTRETRRRQSFLGCFGSNVEQESLPPEKQSRAQSGQDEFLPLAQLQLGLVGAREDRTSQLQGESARIETMEA